ncbi:hypothetical protein [Neobacillus citreus]|uniref:Uncharacterized protein n=1 Tax=Neobacillus citreus TaxID=2833578 RepID=A0A942T5J6_9BACI|nr:hypothetical protein [Neobacillus citreus]MCH6269527.1 hypothetical protein [Neobacillus citreus]
MKKINWFLFSAIVILIAAGWFTYQKVTDETYEGMSIIPEQHKDIPLFKGLKPTRHEYVMEGNHWKEIYDFYKKEMPKNGWKIDLEQSSPNEDVPSSMITWRKKGIDWELSISVSYFKLNNQTEVIFDKNPILHSTEWIGQIPNAICIYKSTSDENCSEIQDPSQITELVRIINGAIDWNGKVQPREKTTVIRVGDIKIKVLYEGDKEIYLQSEKGTKIMKPESEFFKLMNL